MKHLVRSERTIELLVQRRQNNSEGGKSFAPLCNEKSSAISINEHLYKFFFFIVLIEFATVQQILLGSPLYQSGHQCNVARCIR